MKTILTIIITATILVVPLASYANVTPRANFLKFIEQRRTIRVKQLAIVEAREQEQNQVMTKAINERKEQRLQEAGVNPEEIADIKLQPLTFGKVKNIKPSSAIATYLLPTNVGRNKWENVIDNTIEAGGNAIIFDVKDSRVYFDTTSPIAQELGLISKHAYELEPILEEAKSKGLYTIARFVALKDEGFTVAKPDVLTVHPQTGNRISPGWADPSNPVTRQRSRPYWLVYKTLQGYKDFLGPEHSHKLRPWLQAYSVSAWDVRETIDATIDAGGCGFMFWNIGNNFEPVYNALRNWEQPERCR